MRPRTPGSIAACRSFVALAVGMALPAHGAPAWTDVFDGGALQADRGTLVLTDAAGNAVVLGEVTDRFANANLSIRKLDRTTGEPIWTRAVLGTPDKGVVAGGAVWDGDHNLLIGGTRLGCFG